MESVNLYLYILCLTVTIECCSPGGGYRYTRPKFVKNTIPETNEHSHVTSGPFVRHIRKNDTSLKQVLSTNIMFKDQSFDSEARLSILPCHISLLALARRTKIHWKGEIVLYVTEGYLGKTKHGKRRNSLHYEGRAFDIVPVKPLQKSGKVDTFVNPKSILRSLAILAYYEARFTFVSIHKGHIHVSCRKTVRTATTSRCFPGNSFVRLSNGSKLKMKDLKPGDNVLTMNTQGVPVYSEVTMIMHQKKDIIVDDYIKLSTKNGREIYLSSYHLIFISKTKSIFAKDIKLGQNIFTYDVSNNKCIISTVTNTSIVSKVGVYAPLTMEGTIIVDDVYASCYALFPSHSISHAVFWVWRTLYPYLKHSETFMKSNTEYHWYADTFRTSMNYFSIFPYVM